MSTYLLHTFYLFDMEKVNVIFHIFMKLMTKFLPKLAAMFNELGIQCSVFLFEWIVCGFANIFPLEVSARLWDSFFFYGDYYLMKICLAVATVLEKQVLAPENDSFEMLIILFKNIGKYVGAEQLFTAIDKVQLTEKQYDTYKREIEN